MGRFPLLRRYSVKLLTTALRQRSFKTLDALIDLWIPAFVNIMAIAVVFGLTNFLFLLLGAETNLYFVVWSIVVMLGLLHLFLGLVIAGDKSLWKTVAYVPRYVVWKILLYARILRKGHNHEWVRTSRDS